jgi:hypothetical protein
MSGWPRHRRAVFGILARSGTFPLPPTLSREGEEERNFRRIYSNRQV